MDNAIAKWALGVSLFSAVVSVVATCVSIRQVDLAVLAVSDQRAALLMNQRIDACVALYDLGRDVEEKSRAVYYIPTSGPLAAPAELVRENERELHEAIMRTGDAAHRVRLLGPTALAEQASRISSEASAVHQALLGPEPERENYEAARTRLETVTVTFSVACGAVIARFGAEDERVAAAIARMSQREDERNAPRTPSD